MNFLNSPSPKTILGTYFKEWGYAIFSKVGFNYFRERRRPTTAGGIQKPAKHMPLDRTFPSHAKSNSNSL